MNSIMICDGRKLFASALIYAHLRRKPPRLLISVTVIDWHLLSRALLYCEGLLDCCRHEVGMETGNGVIFGWVLYWIDASSWI